MPYFVFRRQDGYVGVIQSASAESAHRSLDQYRTLEGRQFAFRIILETHDWAQVMERLNEARTSPDYPKKFTHKG